MIDAERKLNQLQRDFTAQLHRMEMQHMERIQDALLVHHQQRMIFLAAMLLWPKQQQQPLLPESAHVAPSPPSPPADGAEGSGSTAQSTTTVQRCIADGNESV